MARGKSEIRVLTSASLCLMPSWPRRNTMTDWNLFPAVTLNTLFFIIGAEPIDLKRTTTVCQLYSHHSKLYPTRYQPTLSRRAVDRAGKIRLTLRRVLGPVRVECLCCSLRQRGGGHACCQLSPKFRLTIDGRAHGVGRGWCGWSDGLSNDLTSRSGHWRGGGWTRETRWRIWSRSKISHRSDLPP